MVTMVTKARANIGFREPLLVAAGAFVMLAACYFLISSAHFFELTPQALGKYFPVKWLLLAHISGGACALVLGPLLLWRRVRKRSLRVHRLLGLTYLALVAVSGACAVYLSLSTAYAVNWAYAFSLQVWVGVWLTSAAVAYRAAWQRKFLLHEQWMTRSYVVLVAFVLGALLFKVPRVAALGSFAEISPSIFWFSWAVPLYVYELARASAAKH